MLTDWLDSNCAYGSSVFIPQSFEQLQQFLRTNHAKISIAGSQCSSGGQTLVNNGVILSLKYLNAIKVLNLDTDEVEIEAGSTWDRLIEELIKYERTVLHMQSYGKFSLGGTIGVNGHGRTGYRMSDSIVWIDVLLSNGDLVRCNPTSDLFQAVVGGYGLIGIVYKVCLKIQQNVPIICHVSMSSGRLDEEIQQESQGSLLYNCDITQTGQIFHNVWRKCLTGESAECTQSSSYTRRLFSRISENVAIFLPLIHMVYQQYVPIFARNQIRMLSYEMSYPLEDRVALMKKPLFQSMLQEYFIPRKYIQNFIDEIRVFQTKYDISILNQSIRKCYSSLRTYLNWIPDDCVSIVLYMTVFDFPNNQAYRRFTSVLIDTSLKYGGTWYCPYFPCFTRKQLLQGYPYFTDFLKVKQKYDPLGKFSSNFWQYINEI